MGDAELTEKWTAGEAALAAPDDAKHSEAEAAELLAFAAILDANGLASFAKRYREAAHHQHESAAWLKGERDATSAEMDRIEGETNQEAAFEIVIDRESSDSLTPDEERELSEAIGGLLGYDGPITLTRIDQPDAAMEDKGVDRG